MVLSLDLPVRETALVVVGSGLLADCWYYYPAIGIALLIFLPFWIASGAAPARRRVAMAVAILMIAILVPCPSGLVSASSSCS